MQLGEKDHRTEEAGKREKYDAQPALAPEHESHEKRRTGMAREKAITTKEKSIHKKTEIFGLMNRNRTDVRERDEDRSHKVEQGETVECERNAHWPPCQDSSDKDYERERAEDKELTQIEWPHVGENDV